MESGPGERRGRSHPEHGEVRRCVVDHKDQRDEGDSHGGVTFPVEGSVVLLTQPVTVAAVTPFRFLRERTPSDQLRAALCWKACEGTDPRSTSFGLVHCEVLLVFCQPGSQRHECLPLLRPKP